MKTAYVTTLEAMRAKAVRWVCAARSVDKTRETINGLRLETSAEGSRTLVATDGRRMHAMPVTGWDLPEDGVWRVRTVRGMGEVWDKMDATYPKWITALEFRESRALRAFAIPTESAAVLLSRSALLGATINPAFASAACAHPACLLEIAVDTEGGRYARSAVRATFEDGRIALLMPLRDEHLASAMAAADQLRYQAKHAAPEAA